MAKFIIIGGGLAGLSAAVYLSKSDHQIELIEATPKLGGRAYSFFDNETQTELDNGQHILIGAYQQTLDYLKTINSIDLLEFQENLKIYFCTKGGKKYEINAEKYFYPFNLLRAIWNYDLLNQKEKFRFIKFILSLLFANENKIKGLSIYDWLKLNGQSENSIKAFWEILAVSALNTNIEEASALLYRRMLIKIFFYGNKASTIILPNAALNKIFVEPATRFLSNYNFKLAISERVEKIKFSKNRVIEIKTNKRLITDFDYLILAIQPNQIEKIKSNLNLMNRNLSHFETSSIISVNLWLEDNPIKEKFFALVNSAVHWVSNHKKYITLVISSANDLVNLSQHEIIEFCIKELEIFIPKFDRKFVTKSRIIKERKATIKSLPDFEKYRENLETNFSNVCLIGDWTNTNLPQTIESAIKSGYEISKNLVKK